MGVGVVPELGGLGFEGGGGEDVGVREVPVVAATGRRGGGREGEGGLLSVGHPVGGNGPVEGVTSSLPLPPFPAP